MVKTSLCKEVGNATSRKSSNILCIFSCNFYICVTVPFFFFAYFLVISSNNILTIISNYLICTGHLLFIFKFWEFLQFFFLLLKESWLKNINWINFWIYFNVIIILKDEHDKCICLQKCKITGYSRKNEKTPFSFCEKLTQYKDTGALLLTVELSINTCYN